MKVLMIGATGTFAGAVVPALTRRGVTVRALIRDESRSSLAFSRGASEVAVGDLTDRRSLLAAAGGGDGVFHLNPAFAADEAELGVNMVAAAKAAGVGKFVFSSVIHPSLSSMINHAAKQPVEEALYESGLDYTVLQPAMFMQILAGAWPAILQNGQITLPYSKHSKMAFVDFRDVADVAATAFTTNVLSRGTFELCAPGMVDRVDIAHLISDAIGRTITAGEVDVQRWAATAPIPPGPFRDGLIAMNIHYDRYGLAGGNALVLRAALDREPRTLRQYFAELAAANPQQDT